MVKEIRIYIEGDKRERSDNISLRQGFSSFFKELREKAGEKNIKLRFIMSGSKAETFKDFRRGMESHEESFIAFLLDSDEEIGNEETAKSFLQKQNQKKNENWNWKRIQDEQCHLMVQVMESWFLADIKELGNFYGKDFKKNVLPKNQENQDVEKIPKSDVEDKLKRATEKTTKGEYHKIKHGAELLEKIDVEKVQQASKYCNRLFETIYLQIS